MSRSLPVACRPCDVDASLDASMALHREKLWQALALEGPLQRRQCFQLGALPLHCEYYPAQGSDRGLLIFLPGIGTYVELYAPLLAGLADRGYHVVAMDYPGHGFSGGLRGHYRVADITASVSRVIDACHELSTGPVSVFGYSIGGMLAVAAAESDARIKAVISHTLLVPDIPPDAMHGLGWLWLSGASMFAPSWRVPLKSVVDFDHLLRNHPAAEWLKTDPLCVYQYPLSTLDSLFTWKARFLKEDIGADMLVLHGDRDEVLPLAYAKRIAARSRTPMTLKVLAGGHMLPWEDPASLVSALDLWLVSRPSR